MIECPNHLTIYNVYDLKQEWEKVLNDEKDEFTIDMTHLEDIDTAGAQLLLTFKKECIERNIRFTLNEINDEMKTFLKLIGCNELINEEVQCNE